MEITMIELFLLAGMTLLSFAIASNAKGKLATTISWIVAILLTTFLVVIVLLAKDHIQNPFKKESEETSMIQNHEDHSEKKKSVEAKASTSSEKKFKTEEAQVAQASVQNMLDKAIACADQIENFQFGDIASISNEDYQEMMQKAGRLRYKAEDISKEFVLMSIPGEMSFIKVDLDEALRDLKTSSARLNAYFTSKNAKEEDVNLSELKKYASRAKASFKKIRREI